jgi:hypothetical protein
LGVVAGQRFRIADTVNPDAEKRSSGELFRSDITLCSFDPDCRKLDYRRIGPERARDFP